MTEVILASGTEAVVFSAEVTHPYWCVLDDPMQEEYLNLCLEAVRADGEAAYHNFLDSTFITDTKTVRDIIETVYI